MRSLSHHKGFILIIAAGVLFAGWLAMSKAAEQTPPPRGGAIVYGVAEQKSDMARMVEAYERLSAQYLSMVQQNLSMMSSDDKQILTKLETIDKKIDELTKKVDAIERYTAPKTEPKPVSAEMK